MADPPRYPDTDSGDDSGVGPNRGEGMPRWVKVFVIIGIVLILLIVVMLSGVVGGQHGPGRHSSSGDVALSSVAMGEDTSPAGGRDG